MSCQNIKFVLIVAIFWGIQSEVQSQTTPIRQCLGNHPVPLMVQIDDCTELPCSLHKDVGSNIAIQFVATKNSMSKLKSEVTITTLGIKTAILLDEQHSNVCGNLLFGAYCPLDTEEDVTYYLNLKMDDKHPEVSSRLEISIIDEEDKSVVACFVTDTKVQRMITV